MLNRRTVLPLLMSPLAAGARKWRPKKDFEARLKGWMENAGVPAVSIALMDGGDLAWAEAYGSAKPDTLFAAASLSKQLTAEGAMRLRDAGKLDFSKPLQDYVEATEDPRGRNVTAKHVLCHSGGFPNWRFDPKAELKAAFEPGSKFSYSGEGYVWLQRVMEKVSGKPFELLMKELVMDPVGMRRSSFAGAVDSDAVKGHNRSGEPHSPPLPGPAVTPQASWNFDEMMKALSEAKRPAIPANAPINAAASLWTSPSQYVNFMRMVRNRTEIRATQVPVLGSLSWGLGWGIEQMGSTRYLWQWGDNTGFKNFVLFEPVAGWGIVVFTNGDAGARVYDRVITDISGTDHPALLRV